jgi:ribosomal RNA-processing protein 9
MTGGTLPVRAKIAKWAYGMPRKPNGSEVSVVTETPYLCVLQSRPTSQPIHAFNPFADQSIAFRKGTRQLYTASYDRTIKLFDLSVMGYVETLFGHQDCILDLDALRGETAVSVGGRDKTVRFWKIVDETQLVFRGGGRSSVRELLEGGGLADVDEEDRDDKKKEGQPEKRCIEGSLECVVMIDESTFLSGGDSG